MKCPNCHAELADQSKFCTKCGTRIVAQPPIQETWGAQPQQTYQQTYQQQPYQQQPQQQTYQQQTYQQQTYQQQTYRQPQQNNNWQSAASGAAQNSGKGREGNKKSGGGIVFTIVIILLLVVILALGGWLLWRKFSSGGLSVGDNSETTESVIESTEVVTEPESSQTEETTESVAADPALLDELDDRLTTLQADADSKLARDLVSEGIELIEQYEELADENDLVPEASEKIQAVFDTIIPPALSYCDTIENQHLGNGSYVEITETIEPVTEKAAALTEKGYTVDVSEAAEYSDGLVGRMRDYYIGCINEITSRDQWSRDEAWAYAEQAYAIQRDGKLVLFDEDEKDDPLTLRYEYCLARITLKRCETGLADGSMTNEGAFNEMTAILPQTDYNLLILQGAIDYGTAAGIDVTAYQNAYNAIVDQLKNGQNLTIVHSGENSGTTVDLQKFWYFNDLDGDTDYQVDIHNGTTQATRTWIRENIPAYFE